MPSVYQFVKRELFNYTTRPGKKLPTSVHNGEIKVKVVELPMSGTKSHAILLNVTFRSAVKWLIKKRKQ